MNFEYKIPYLGGGSQFCGDDIPEIRGKRRQALGNCLSPRLPKGGLRRFDESQRLIESEVSYGNK